MLDRGSIQTFRELVWDYYNKHARELPWRKPGADGAFDPYKILVSEIMLQQTQVPRVIPKYKQFLERFPTIDSLASATLAEVFAVWNGLGYNRRAKFLHQAARIMKERYQSTIPQTMIDLVSLPGIGENTAAAILTYAYNEPHVFIETNVRTVFIHHFFEKQASVSDADIAEYVAITLPRDDTVREWYWALMDYGSYLKTTIGNMARFSAHYAKQSKYEGSRRQLRAQVLKLLLEKPYTAAQFKTHTTDARLQEVLATLEKEGFITFRKGTYHLV